MEAWSIRHSVIMIYSTVTRKQDCCFANRLSGRGHLCFYGLQTSTTYPCAVTGFYGVVCNAYCISQNNWMREWTRRYSGEMQPRPGLYFTVICASTRVAHFYPMLCTLELSSLRSKKQECTFKAIRRQNPFCKRREHYRGAQILGKLHQWKDVSGRFCAFSVNCSPHGKRKTVLMDNCRQLHCS